MTADVTDLTPRLLRGWPLPEPGSSKYERGSVLVVGGAAKTPGAVALTGLGALRVGAGHLSAAVAEPVAVPLAVALPESGVTPLPATPSGSVSGQGMEVLADELHRTDVVVVGPGLDAPDETATLLEALVPLLGPETGLLLDAFALGCLPHLASPIRLPGRLVLTPNDQEAARLLEGSFDATPEEVVEIAHRYDAVVACHDLVATPDGRLRRIGSGHAGLATSGSGDVLSGAIAGIWARGASPEQAACWGKQLHTTAGDRLAARVGPIGFLAREIIDELPAVLRELTL
ncbi:MAG TPA: NAD(P)H-hydrate dehydratase [Propionibacteriaceae bacterium]|nr:NAD(P)H-hydrate dehydratase [Propionibacteriaceae bacterium]